MGSVITIALLAASAPLPPSLGATAWALGWEWHAQHNVALLRGTLDDTPASSQFLGEGTHRLRVYSDGEQMGRWRPPQIQCSNEEPWLPGREPNER